MSVLNPLWLWGMMAGLGVAVAVGAHLFSRRRVRETEWAAMSLLRRALADRGREVRIEDRALLLLRCLAVVLIAAAMARPALRGAAAGWFGGPQSVGVVLGVDVSGSMSYRDLRARLDHARRAALELASGLEPGEPISLLAMGAEPRVLLDRVGYSEARLRNALAGLEAEAGRLAVQPNLRRLAELARQTRADVRQCYILSDGQATTWSEPGSDAAAALEAIASHATVRWVMMDPSPASNLTLARFERASGGLRVGTSARYEAEVRNGGAMIVEGATLTVYHDGEAVERVAVPPIKPGEAATEGVMVRFEEAGPTTLEARLSPDGLVMDDARWTVASVRRRVEVLVVDGDPSPRRYASESSFITAALRPTPGAGAASLGVEVVDAEALDGMAGGLDGYDVVILANVGRVAEATGAALDRWVRGGGGLMIFPGDLVAGSVFNRQFAAGAAPLSPARVVGVVGGGADHGGWSIEGDVGGGRLARVLTALPGDVAGAARVRRYFQLDPTPDARTVWTVSGQGHPALVAARRGRGAVLLFASTGDRDWTDMPVFPVFPMMLHEAVTELTSPGYEGAKTLGERVTVELDRVAAGGEVRVLRPDGALEQPTIGEADGRIVATHRPAGPAGIHRFTTDEEGGGAIPVAFNLDPREGALRTVDAGSMSVALGESVEVLGASEDRTSLVAEGRAGRELWRWLMGAGLALLVVESWLARRFSKAVEAGGGGVTGMADRVAGQRGRAA